MAGQASMDHRNANTSSCPFCPFSDSDSGFVAEHVAFCHPENAAPSDDGFGPDGPSLSIQTLTLASSTDEGDYAEQFVDCPHKCGEVVALSDLPTHLDLHVAEGVAFEDLESRPVQARSQRVDIGDHKLDKLENKYALKQNGRSQKQLPSRVEAKKANRPRSPVGVPAGNIKRLGRSELGPYAHEKNMPSWLRKMLERGGRTTRKNIILADGRLLKYEEIENETPDIIPMIARLCGQDESTQRIFLCSPKVRQISKMHREGGFCGYRNIQMLISYIQQSKAFGPEQFPGKTPTVLMLQDMIEQAWDMGFNSVGRIETGGIRGTRKYIGTSEAQALFSSLGIPCEAQSIGGTADLRAYDALYLNIAEYFRSGCSLEGNEKVIMSNLPPVYLQHQGHSITIIGFEIRSDGSANLLVFDPVYRTSPAMKRFIREPSRAADPARLLKAYRRGVPYLQKYSLFEILKLRPAHVTMSE